jgi:1-deoxy-D-xylulose-5-phosphate reductoisomerase
VKSQRIQLAILGSTGSIGRQTLDVVAANRHRMEVVGLAAGRPTDTFDAQLRAWPSAQAWLAQPDATAAERLGDRWAEGGLEQLATLPDVDLVVVATTGGAALPAVLAALQSRKRVALANKETLVTGGHLVAPKLDELGGDRLDWLRPIDSEHSAIWQCLLGERPDSIARLILTASGGPFRGRAEADLAAVTPDQALAHPTWRMGPKITIDSATLVNKAFEAIEARWLYRLPYSRIEALIHPQSVVHSLVEFIDGSFKAQLGLPDMHLPIQYALTYPERVPSPARTAPPTEWATLEFLHLPTESYPAYWTVREAAARGGNRGAVLNAADEVAVAAFLRGRIGFTQIATVIAAAVERWGSDVEPDLAEIAAADAEVRAALTSELDAEPSA